MKCEEVAAAPDAGAAGLAEAAEAAGAAVVSAVEAPVITPPAKAKRRLSGRAPPPPSTRQKTSEKPAQAFD